MSDDCRPTDFVRCAGAEYIAEYIAETAGDAARRADYAADAPTYGSYHARGAYVADPALAARVAQEDAERAERDRVRRERFLAARYELTPAGRAARGGTADTPATEAA